MASTVTTSDQVAAHRGLRMSADDYLTLGENAERYELIDGVVCMSPSPSYRHQKIITEVAGQIRNHLMNNPVGEVAVEADVRFSDKLVYRPDVIFLTAAKAVRCPMQVTEVPDVVVEVVSPDSRRLDRQTKKDDYERFGVGEYWIIDPERQAFTFHRLLGDKFTEVPPGAHAFDSEAIPGFSLDTRRLVEFFA